MTISKEAMILILSRFQVFPLFNNILMKFELRVKESCTAINCMSPFYSRNESIEGENSSELQCLVLKESILIHFLGFETTYTLNYVELNNRPSDSNKWSIRQMGVYQRYNTATMDSNCILIQSSNQAQRRILELSNDSGLGNLANHWSILHEVYLGTLGQDWGLFLQSININIGSTVSILCQLYCSHVSIME
jgi:hypothetical protein